VNEPSTAQPTKREQAKPEPHNPGSAGGEAPLATLESSRTRAEVLDRLANAARRGRLAGFRRLEGGASFEFDAYATPFDYRGIGTIEPRADGAGSVIRFETRVRRKMVVIAAVVLIATLWPGLPLTESMIDTYWAWHRVHVQTWWWYVPMWALGLPWVWSAWKKCRREAEGEARQMIAKIEQELR